MFQRVSEWFATLSGRGQMLWGCLAVLVLSSCIMYGLAGVSFFVRPYLVAAPIALNTVIIPPTQLATPTQALPSTMELPGSTLVATPTQAPLPTRAPTATPTPDEIPSITPQETASGSITDTPVEGTATPTNTRRPTRTRTSTITGTPKQTRTKAPKPATPKAIINPSPTGPSTQ